MVDGTLIHFGSETLAPASHFDSQVSPSQPLSTFALSVVLDTLFCCVWSERERAVDRVDSPHVWTLAPPGCPPY